MVVRAVRVEPEIRAGRTLSFSARARRWHHRQDLGTRGRAALPSRACSTHPARGTRGVVRGHRLTRQHSALRVLGILVHRHRAAATGKELPRRRELAEHRNRECGSALGAQSVRNPPGPRPPRSHLPVQFPGLAEAPALQLQHPVGADAVEGSASCCGVPARLHSASPQALAGEPRTDCSEAVAGARVATTPCAPPGACRLRSGREVREGAWPGWSQGAIVEVQREGGVEREDGRAGGAARAGAPEVAPSARDNLRSGGGVKPNLATSFPREPRARCRGPRAPFWRALAPQPPRRAKAGRERRGGRALPVPNTRYRFPAYGQRGRKS